LEISPARNTGILIPNSLSSLTIVKNPPLPGGTKKHTKKKILLTYLDTEVSRLPFISFLHPHYKEWRIAQEYCKRTIEYIRQKGSNVNILVAGCGNGWLAATLSKHTVGYVMGIDADMEEIKQAKRVFATIPNLQFEQGGIDAPCLQQKQFEIIIMADCIQYKDELPALLHKGFNYLTLFGEVLVIVSFLKKQYRITLESFRFNILHKPSYFFSRYAFTRNPFYHIVVKNHYL
jgi:ubiquinone/menaquinone biosynthesis C-methylase UbiE